MSHTINFGLSFQCLTLTFLQIYLYHIILKKGDFFSLNIPKTGLNIKGLYWPTNLSKVLQYGMVVPSSPCGAQDPTRTWSNEDLIALTTVPRLNTRITYFSIAVTQVKRYRTWRNEDLIALISCRKKWGANGLGGGRSGRGDLIGRVDRKLSSTER